ncbi:MAG: leucine-rich repeat-containing protein kinase family protein [Bacteroidota bacterium]
MQTLQQLLSGELKGSKTLQLSCELTLFPNEIFDLADTLEILDLSNNKLSQLPENFCDLKKLKIAFFSDNDFVEFPAVLAQCPSLTMIGFKSNKIKLVPENAFPVNLQWLILTNNFIERIPHSIGLCSKLQKVAFAGNNLKSLPEEMANCKNIELLRIAANQLTEFPQWLLTLPRLSWLAYSGNPFSKTIPVKDELPVISWNELTIHEILGQGASGIISKATWNNLTTKKEVAVKVFKGEVTSDGFPEDEMNACITAGNHENLVAVLGKIKNHPEQKPGLVLELIPPTFKNLAGPPSFETCTRDTFKPGTVFTSELILKICTSVALASYHLHQKGIMHGDLYAHNTLFDKEGTTIFGDFGAATIYAQSDANATLLERLDVRAFGCFMDDLLNQVDKNKTNESLFLCLSGLKTACLNEAISNRPSFFELKEMLLIF